MDGDAILDELATQLLSADPALRAKAFQTSLSKLKTLNLHTRSLEQLFCKMEGASIADLIRDIKSDQPELASSAATFLSIRLRADSSTMKLELGQEVITAICDAISKTSDKTACEKLLTCFSAQSFTPQIIVDQLDKILLSLETGQCRKHFNSHSIELEAVTVITRLLEQVPVAMEVGVTQWAHLVYPLVIHKKSVIRNQANLAFRLGLSAMKGNASVAKQMLDDLKPDLVNAFVYLMKNHQETYSLAVWSSYVEILGPLLHRGSSINCLLPIVEMGFKNPNLEVKICAYKAWQAIIDNFALSEEIISDSKRIKLILKVFLTCNVKSESVAVEKFHVWWHFIRSLGRNCVPWFEQVVLPILQFSLHGKYAVSSSETRAVLAKKASPSVTSPPGLNTSGGGLSLDETSPLSAIYRPLLQKGCEALVMILSKGCDHCIPENAFSSYTLDRLEHDVLGKGLQAAKHLPFLINCAKNCFLSAVIQNDEEVSLLWSLVVNHVKNLLETTDVALKQDRQNALEALLDTLSIVTETELFSAEQNLSMIVEVLTLPPKVLSSSSYHIGNTTEVMKGCPCLYIIELLFRSKTLERCAATKGFHNTVDRVIVAGFHNSNGVLSFCHSACEMLTKHILESVVKHDDLDISMNGIKPLEEDGLSARSSPVHEKRKSGEMEKSVGSDEACYLSVWSSIANHLHDHILKSNEVNQGNNLEHDFSCLHTLLMFPMHVIGNSVAQQQIIKSVTKLWTSIYATFFRLSSMVQNAGPNVACEEFCERLLTLLQEKSQEDRVLFDFICQCAATIAATADMSGVYSGTSAFGLNSPNSSYQTIGKRKRRLLGNLHSLTKLVEVLLNSLCEHIQTESLTQQSLMAVIQITEALFNKRLPSSFLFYTLRLLTNPLARLYQLLSNIQTKHLTLQSTSKLDQLWSVIGNCIQTCHAGAYDADLLELLSPLIAATFGHSRRFIKNQTLKFWNATFGSSGKALSYPEYLRAVLSKVKDRSSIILPGWKWDELTNMETTEQSPVEGELSQMDHPVPPIALKISPRKPVNSPSSVKAATPVQKPSKSNASPQTPSAQRTSKNVQLSIFDDKSEDFVTIASKPTTAKKVLTEHQKEVFRSRSVLPTMYNSLDASVDISLTQFQSDSHAENATSSDSHGPVTKAENQDQQKADAVECAMEVDANNVITDIVGESIVEEDDSTTKARDDDEGAGQNSSSIVVCEKNDSGSQPSQPLPDCRVCLVRLPDFLLSQNSNDSSESMVNKLAEVGNGTVVREGDLLVNKNLPAAQGETLSDKINLELAETPTRNKTAMDLLICENTEIELPHPDGASVVDNDDNDVILVEDSQMPSCGPGHEELQTSAVDHAAESEICIMDTPEKAERCEDKPEKRDQSPFKLFSDEEHGLSSSPEISRKTVNLQQPSVDDLETSRVTVVPDSCAIDLDDVTLCSKDTTSCDALLTVAMETAAVDDVQMKDAVPMETEEIDDSVSCSSILQNTGNIESEISASSMNLNISDVESIAEQDCHTPRSESLVKGGLGSTEGSFSDAELTEKRVDVEIGESAEDVNSSVELPDDSPAAATSVSDVEDHVPLAAFLKKQPLGRGKQATDGERMPKLDQEISATEQQIAADITESKEREPSQVGQQVSTDVQEIPELSSQTQDLPAETDVSMPQLESEVQPLLTELPSQTQPKALQQQVLHTAEPSPTLLPVTDQLQPKSPSLIKDATTPVPTINLSTSSEDDIPLGLLARKSSSVLSDRLQTDLKVDADAVLVLNSLGETQSKLVTKSRSRGRPKRSPYSSMSAEGLTLRTRSLVRSETDSLHISENRCSQRNRRNIYSDVSVVNTGIQGKKIVIDDEGKGENVKVIGKRNVTLGAQMEEKEPNHIEMDNCRVEELEVEGQLESEDKMKNEDESDVNKKKKEPENHDCERQREMIDREKKEETVIEIEDEDEEKNSDAERLNETEEMQNKNDKEKTRTEVRKLKNVASDDNAACRSSESNKNFTRICDPKSAKNFPSGKIKRIVISDGSAVATAPAPPTSGTTVADTDDDAFANDSDINGSTEARRSAGEASKPVAAAAVLRPDATKDSASVISPVVTSSASPGSLRKGRTSEIPLTPTSSSAYHVLSRGHMMLSRSKQLFAMPNSGKLKTAQGGMESPMSFLQPAAEAMRTRSQGSPLLLPSHVFSPSASPSAGILRKKRLREEAPSVDSPSPPHKHRRVCFSDKVDTIEIPNRYQQRRRQVPVTMDSPLSIPAKQINRQLEMTSTPLSSPSSGPVSSTSQNLQKFLSDESGETKDSDLAKTDDVVLEELYSMDCEPSDIPQVLTMTPESQLNCSEPVFPELIGSTAPLDHILPKLTTTTWMIGLRQLLHARNIKTIGNLCSLTELEVHNLPIVQPKVDNLKESLQAFARSNKMSLTNETTNKKNKLETLANEQVGGLKSLQDKFEDLNPEISEVLRNSDSAENESSDTKQVNGDSLPPEGDSGTAESNVVAAAETDIISSVSLSSAQSVVNISSQTLIGEDHEEQLRNMPMVEPEEPSLVQRAEQEYEGDEEFCRRLLSEEISRERALRLFDFGLKLSNKCFQIVNRATSNNGK